MKSNSIEEIRKEVLKLVKPGEEETKRVTETAKNLVERIEKAAGRPTMLVGSVAKGTFLSSDRDIDIFVIYDTDMTESKLRKEVIVIGKKVFGRVEERYAQHPYVHARYEDFEIDLVPAFRFNGRIKSSVDRTPEHVRFVLAHMTEEIRDDILLLKQFAKGIGIYGAEARVQGLSGYLCELFIIRFGSFEEFLKRAKSLEGVISFNACQDRKKEGPLIFIDPVDPNRNVASSLSAENLGLLRSAAEEFLREPILSFFFPNEPRLDERYPRERLFAVDLSDAIELRIEDIYFPQLRKTSTSIARVLEEFGVEKSAIYCDGKRAMLFFLLKDKKLDETEKHKGPPIEMAENARDFINRWGEERCYVQDGRIYATIKRSVVTPGEVLNAAMPEIGVGKGLRKEGIRILDDIPDDIAVRLFLIRSFSGKKPWEF
jgi:tRNA nucleotidyltransferase (CCA-adding enzyme)